MLGKWAILFTVREARTSEERSGGTTDTRIWGFDGICRVRRELSFSILGTVRERLEIPRELIRRPVLDSKVRTKEEEGDQGGGGEECPFSPPKRFGMGCEGESANVEVFFIVEEGIL